MTTETLTKETAKAVDFFEAKLAFEIGPIGIKNALEAKEKIQIVDLRTPEFYATGHIPTAINIGYDQLEANLSKLDKDVTTVVYCYNITCHLAAKGALLLAKKGYKVKELVGGYSDYVDANLPVAEGKEASSCSTTKHGSCG